ncbi:hypothetical protein GGI35DRAFT_225617 [Trichoderma velutinum]
MLGSLFGLFFCTVDSRHHKMTPAEAGNVAVRRAKGRFLHGTCKYTPDAVNNGQPAVVRSGGSRDDEVPAVICLSPYLMQVSAISRALLDDSRAFFSGSRASSFLGLSRQRASRHSASKARQGSRASMSESTKQAAILETGRHPFARPRPRWSSDSSSELP